MATLERAIAIAAEAHAGQTDKAGASYILHPLRVMLSLTNVDDQIVGVLHDVVEDCEHRGWTLERLESEGFSKNIIKAVDSVTKREDEKSEAQYPVFIERASKNPIGRRVKLADLADNCDLSRISSATAKDHERLKKYRDAIVYIQSKIV